MLLCSYFFNLTEKEKAAKAKAKAVSNKRGAKRREDYRERKREHRDEVEEEEASKRMAKREASVHIEIGEQLELTGGGGASVRGNGENAAPRPNQIAPTQVAGAAETLPVSSADVSKPASITSTVFKVLFFVHLLGIAILVSFLSIRGFITKASSFHPLTYFIPLLSSIAVSALAAGPFLLSALHHPMRSLATSLWLSPVLLCLVGALLLIYGTGVSFALGIPAIVFAVSLSLYVCWAGSRVQYACRILSVSVPAVKFSVAVGRHVALALVSAVVYSWFWALGVGGLAASKDKEFDAVYVLLLLLSLTWTMQVIRNYVHVAVSHIAYTHLARGIRPTTAPTAFNTARGRSLGDICIGSLLAPIAGTFRATARGLDILAGEEADEFMFSCTGCCLSTGNGLASHANRWGFVHVGVTGKGFSEASEDAWDVFGRRGMLRLLDSDLTGAFCFLCGVAGGSFAALVCGSWMLAVDEGYATGPTVYALIVGYLMVRIGMAWVQACVSASHVVYAEDPEHPALGPVIAGRIRELQPSQV